MYATRAAFAASCCAQRLLPLRTPPSTSATVLRPISCMQYLCPRSKYLDFSALTVAAQCRILRLPVHQMRKLYFRNSLPSQVNDALGSVLKLARARKHGPRFSFALCLMWQAWDINASAHLWSCRQSFWLHPRWRWQESTRAVRSIDSIQVFRPE